MMGIKGGGGELPRLCFGAVAEPTVATLLAKESEPTDRGGEAACILAGTPLIATFTLSVDGFADIALELDRMGETPPWPRDSIRDGDDIASGVLPFGELTALTTCGL